MYFSKSCRLRSVVDSFKVRASIFFWSWNFNEFDLITVLMLSSEDVLLRCSGWLFLPNSLERSYSFCSSFDLKIRYIFWNLAFYSVKLKFLCSFLLCSVFNLMIGTMIFMSFDPVFLSLSFWASFRYWSAES